MARPEEYEDYEYELDLAAEETPMTDDEILDTVERLFAVDERIDDSNMEITVENGVVYLEGAVGTQEEKEMAESLLDDIEGIQAVENSLQVVLSGFTPDERLAGPLEEEEFEDIEVLPADEDLVSEDPLEVVEEGKSYVPPNEPILPTERAYTAERMRERRAQKEATGEARDQL